MKLHGIAVALLRDELTAWRDGCVTSWPCDDMTMWWDDHVTSWLVAFIAGPGGQNLMEKNKMVMHALQLR